MAKVYVGPGFSPFWSAYSDPQEYDSSLVPRLSGMGGGGGGEPGLYCEQKWLRNNPLGQDLTLYDSFTLTFINIYVTLLYLRPPVYRLRATLLSPHFSSKHPLCYTKGSVWKHTLFPNSVGSHTKTSLPLQ